MLHYMVHRAEIVKSACWIEAVYMCFNETSFRGGETIMGQIFCSFTISSRMENRCETFC